MKKCPYCKEDIQDDAIKCKHCGSMFKIDAEKASISTKEVPNCGLCGSVMKKSKEAKSGGMGCLLLIIGVLLCLTLYGAIIGIPLIIYALHLGSKRRGLWVCTKCGHQVERKIKWNEWG